MSSQIVNQEWYTALVDECKAIVTEAVFTSRWALVEGYWRLGKTIREENNLSHKEAYGKEIVQDLAQSIGVSKRTLNYAIQAYDKFPSLDQIPEGKNISWNKMVTKYLPNKKKEKEEVKLPKEYIRCPKCYHQFANDEWK